ncbi:MAG: sigma 54-interacting transcriptional regulator [Thermoanaerobaculia bacterium]
MPDFEQFLSDTFRSLLDASPETFPEVATAVIEGIVQRLDTDRATLQHLDGDGVRIRLAWGRPGLTERIPAPDATLRMRWYVGELAAGRTIAVERVPDDLPETAQEERDYTTAIGMKANLTVPLTVAGRFRWSIATASFRKPRTWSERDIHRLRSVGDALAAASERIELELALKHRLEQIEELHRRLRAETDYLREERTALHGFAEIVGRSPALLATLALLEQVAPTPSTVLLLGETGTGKELMARAIHQRSPRADGPLVMVNCAAMPATLIESELFGHEQGAFTGATKARAGRFEIAAGGTLFLDEIGDLPLEMQIKLLRVIQQRDFQRLGSSRVQKADVRLIAATHRDLEEEVRAGRFRSDLFFRLNVFPIRIPPLRERREDIPLLVWAFVERLQSSIGKKVERIREPDLEALTAYDWPGNVRELENVIERALILTRDETLAVPAGFASSGPNEANTPKSLRLEDHERDHIAAVLARCGGKIAGEGGAAERLGLHPNTLRSRMLKLGLSRSSTR